MATISFETGDIFRFPAEGSVQGVRDKDAVADGCNFGIVLGPGRALTISGAAGRTGYRRECVPVPALALPVMEIDWDSVEFSVRFALETARLALLADK